MNKATQNIRRLKQIRDELEPVHGMALLAKSELLKEAIFLNIETLDILNNVFIQQGTLQAE